MTANVNFADDATVKELVKKIAKLEERADKAEKFKTKAKEQISELDKGVKYSHKFIKKNEGAALTNASKYEKIVTKCQAIEDTMKLMERMSNASADGGKGIMQSFVELEDRIKDFCKENFAAGPAFLELKDDFSKRVGLLEDHNMQHLRRLKGLDEMTEMIQKRTAKHEK